MKIYKTTGDSIYLGLYLHPDLNLSSHNAHVFCFVSTWYSYTVSCKDRCIELSNLKWLLFLQRWLEYIIHYREDRLSKILTCRLSKSSYADSLTTHLCRKLSFQLSQKVVHLFSAIFINWSTDWPNEREEKPQFNHTSIAFLMSQDLYGNKWNKFWEILWKE